MAEVHGNRTSAKNTKNLQGFNKGGANTGADYTDSIPIDQDLRLVVETWPDLDDEARKQLLSIVREYRRDE